MYEVAVALGREADTASSDDDALALYLRAWEAVPHPRFDWDGGTWIWSCTADIYIKRGDYAKALDAARNGEASYRGSVDSDIMMLMGEILLDGYGDREGAASYFRRASDLSEGRALRGRPREYRELAAGNLDAVSKASERREARRARNMEPEAALSVTKALFEAGERLVHRNKTGQAIEKFEDAVSLIPAPIEAFELFTMVMAAIGDVHAAAQRWEEASQAFNQALMGPGGVENPFLHLRLAQCALALGWEATAVEELLHAYMLDGDTIFTDHPELLIFLKSRVDLGG